MRKKAGEKLDGNDEGKEERKYRKKNPGEQSGDNKRDRD